MRVLVLGGNRYIGLHLVRELARTGHDVTVCNSHEVVLPDGVRRLHADRQQPGALHSVLADHRSSFDAVFDNTAYRVSDLEPLLELFGGRVEHYVFTSSAAVYKRSFIQPVQETFRTHRAGDPDPRKAYGVGKVECEERLLDEHRERALPATILRVSHTIGPHSPLVTREPGYFLRLEQGLPILVPGEGFPFVHLVHVADVASLMVSILGCDRAVGQVFNVAGAEVTSVLGSIQLMAKTVGVQPNLVHVPLDVARRAHPPIVHWGEALVGGAVLSIDKALATLEWAPSFGLESGYRDSYEWFTSVGRERYQLDRAGDEAVLAQLAK